MLLKIQIMLFFCFKLSFRKVCFHTVLNKSKNIVFYVNVSPCVVFAFDWLQASISSLAISPRYQAAVFPLAYASSIVLDNSFRKHSAIIFQYIYIFSNLNMVIRLSNSCFSLFIYRGTPPCDHPVYTTTSCLSSPPIVFPPRRENLRVILLFWRPL